MQSLRLLRRKILRPRAWIPQLIVLVLVASATAAATPTQIDGAGRIVCQVAVPFFPAMDCDIGGGGSDHRLPRATRDYVDFTVRWNATSPAAEHLQIEVFGNPQCQNHEPPSCVRDVAVGPSPLTVRLEGRATRDAEVVAGVLLAPVCQGMGCEVPPLRIVMDQPYAFTWTFE